MGPTCFAGSGTGSAIDFGVAQDKLARWLWHGTTLDAGLATHRPIQWHIRWKWAQKVEVAKKIGKAPLERIIGPKWPPPSSTWHTLERGVEEAVARWGGAHTQGSSASAEQKAAIDDLMKRWHREARGQAQFTYGEDQTPVRAGDEISVEQVDPADLVRKGKGLQLKEQRAQAMRWCVKRLNEAARGHSSQPQGDKWWKRWEKRLRKWGEEGVVRPWLPSFFMQVWSQWPDSNAIAARAEAVIPKFQRLLEQDEKEASQIGRAHV